MGLRFLVLFRLWCGVGCIVGFVGLVGLSWGWCGCGVFCLR